ncbi:MAG: FtsW/RodA/SpoVE family cell cycle protein [Methylacidiphilales bacterium]|nr:FtsW/RodA/SpoVE family cell cycle protein [Candidatus Methylacidiphilales bacterium]
MTALKNNFSTPFPHVNILLPVLILVIVGLLVMTSATIHLNSFNPWYYTQKHIIFLTIGIVSGFFIYNYFSFDKYQQSKSIWVILYLISIILLLTPIIPILGVEHYGARRWIRLPFGFEFQTSEIAKITLIMSMSSYLQCVSRKSVIHVHRLYWNEVKQLGFYSLWLLLPTILFALQKDFGSIVAMFVVWFVLLYLYRFSLRVLLLIIPICLVLFAVLIIMEPYRVERVINFQKPFTYNRELLISSAKDTGYQILQSKIALVQGGLFGVGVGEGVQKLLHLPKAHNDFIFSTIVEEYGVIGAVFLLLVFTSLIITLLRDASRFSQNSATCSASLHTAFALWIFCLVLLHIGSGIGFLPTKGITLPFISYGGSNLVSLLLFVALLSSCRKHSNKEMAKAI